MPAFRVHVHRENGWHPIGNVLLPLGAYDHHIAGALLALNVIAPAGDDWSDCCNGDITIFNGNDEPIVRLLNKEIDRQGDGYEGHT